MAQAGNVEHEAQARLDAGQVAGSERAGMAASGMAVHLELAEQVGELARIDFHGARGGAESVGGAGLIAVVTVLPAQGGEPGGVAARGLQLAHLALNGYAHAAGERQAA